MENEYFQRSVLVTFKQGVELHTIENFKKGLSILAKNSSGLICMNGYDALALEHESTLSNKVPNVGFPDYMSTWLFDSIESLNAFICSALHQKVAEEYFKPAVDKRIVFNSRVVPTSVNTAQLTPCGNIPEQHLEIHLETHLEKHHGET